MPKTNAGVIPKTRERLLQYFRGKVEAQGGNRDVVATYADISRDSNIAYATVKNGLQALIDEGLVRMEESRGRRSPNTYTYLGPLPEGVADGDGDAEADPERLLEELAKFLDLDRCVQGTIAAGPFFVVVARTDAGDVSVHVSGQEF